MSEKATTAIEPTHDDDTDDDGSLRSAVMGGSLRGVLLYLGKTVSLKAFIRKRAVMEIFDNTSSVEAAIAPKPRTSIHPKFLVASQSMIMGTVVFGTYDNILKQWKEDAPVWVHGSAGAAAGTARSIVWFLWERTVYHIPHRIAFCWRTTLHHSVNHGTLFSTYEGARRLLSLHETTRDSYLGTFLAGGWAGQVHHLAQHYTSHWRQFRAFPPPPPRLRPTIQAFGPMGLCFLAFEYGADGVDEIVDQVQDTLESFSTPRKRFG